MKSANAVISKGSEFEMCIQRISVVNLNITTTQNVI